MPLLDGPAAHIGERASGLDLDQAKVSQGFDSRARIVRRRGSSKKGTGKRAGSRMRGGRA